MKQYLKCLTIVAFVAMLSSALASHSAAPAPKPVSKPAVKAAIKVQPAPIPPVVPVPAYAATGCSQYLPLISQYDWNVNVALAIMQAENHSCATAITSLPNHNGTVDIGLFQVNSSHADMVNGDLESLHTPTVNVAIAYKLYAARHSWTPWTTFNSGSYTRYLK